MYANTAFLVRLFYAQLNQVARSVDLVKKLIMSDLRGLAHVRNASYESSFSFVVIADLPGLFYLVLECVSCLRYCIVDTGLRYRVKHFSISGLKKGWVRVLVDNNGAD